jgi:hypothetical protein
MAAVPPQATVGDIVEAIAKDLRGRGEPNIEIDVTEADLPATRVAGAFLRDQLPRK